MTRKEALAKTLDAAKECLSNLWYCAPPPIKSEARYAYVDLHIVPLEKAISIVQEMLDGYQE